MNYYNEIDPKAAAWLRELIKQGLIPDGIVDERSITEIKPNELKQYTQCHFFAGIGGWSLALQLAGWPATRPVWTGSCPCQPFSSAGKQLGDKDERHLWPIFFDLIRECRPECVFGEQVASAIGKGWLDGVSADLESENYACGATVLGAHSVRAPHIRQRLYWVADSTSQRRQHESPIPGSYNSMAGKAESRLGVGGGSDSGGLADPASGRFAEPQQLRSVSGETDGERTRNSSGNDSGDSGVEHTNSTGSQPGIAATKTNGHGRASFADGSNSWSDYDIIPCGDGKTRRIEPGSPPLANGIPARVVRLRGYGNAIVPQVAAEFVQAFVSIS